MVRKIILLTAAFSMVFIFGCAQPQKPNYQDGMCLKNCTVDAAMCNASQLLRRMNFKIDKMDAADGYLSTRPLAGAQMFEFWRSDNATMRNALEANLHSITRRVEMTFDQAGPNVSVDVRVNTQRLSVKEKEIASIVEAPRVFTKSSSSVQGLRIDAKDPDLVWIDLGRDNALENKIVSLLSKK